MSEIMSVVEAAKTYAQQNKSWIILPLHSALSVEEQEKVFELANLYSYALFSRALDKREYLVIIRDIFC